MAYMFDSGRDSARLFVLVGLICGLLLCPLARAGQGGQPAIFYSDIDSGPKQGGERNGGAFVTIYGKAFGTAQGSSIVSVGGGHAADYPIWTDSKITFQLGAAAQSGDIVVETTSGSSNAIPFTVRPGKVHFVAPKGKDAGPGTFTTPWATIPHARDAMAAGDVTYVRSGVAAEVDDGSGWNGCLVLGSHSGAPNQPKALVVYPGESATIGSLKPTREGGCDAAVRTKGYGENYWTIAGFKLRGEVAISTAAVNNWRLIANDVSCPKGNSQAGCLTFGYKSTSLRVYGNTIHDVATSLDPGAVTALYHGVYFADGSAHIWFGWNEVANIRGCRGIQQNDSTGVAFDLHIHDNVIHDTQCDGIVMTTVNPSQGTVELYNNVIYNAGTGPNNKEGSGSWSCMNLQGYGPGSGTVEVYHNTMYNCGPFRNPPYSGSNAGLLWIAGQNSNKNVRFVNNIVVTPRGVPYVRIYGTKEMRCSFDNCPLVRGANNLFFGNGSGPENANLNKSINGDPQFVSAGRNDFHLSPKSAAHRAASDPAPSRDKDGNVRGAQAGSDVGAFQL